MPTYKQPLWWVREKLNKDLKRKTVKNREDFIKGWCSQESKAYTARYFPTDKAPWLDYLKMVSNEFGINVSKSVPELADIDGKPGIRLYIETPELLEFLKTTGFDLNTAVYTALDFIEKFDDDFSILAPDGKTYTYKCVSYKVWGQGQVEVPSVAISSVGKDVVLSTYILSTDGEIHCEYSEKSSELYMINSVEELPEILKLGIAVLYYIATFPDALVDGIITDKGDRSKPIKGRRDIVMTTHPDIIETSPVSGARATHLRRGHYRFLKSEKFVNKHGQFVFVKAAIVHGAPAKTVVG